MRRRAALRSADAHPHHRRGTRHRPGHRGRADRAGHDVVATARDPSLLADLAGARVHALDVTDDASVATCLAAVGELDAVVNNAAIIGSGPLEDYPIDQFRQVVETNLFGALRMIQGVVPGWRGARHRRA